MTQPAGRALLLAALLSGAAGCSFQSAVPDDAQIRCETNAECPSGWRCSSHQRCGRDDGRTPTAGDLEVSYRPQAAALVPSPNAVSPVCVGQLSFDTSEEVYPPTVTACDGAVRCELRDDGPTRFTFDCAVADGAAEVEKKCDVRIDLEDRAGVRGERTFAGALLLDSQAPVALPVEVEGALVHQRSPWSGAGQAPFARLRLEAPLPDEALVAYASEQNALAVPVVVVGAFGAGTLELPDPMISRVLAARVDRAGNVSSAVRVLEEEVTIEFGDDATGAPSPHRMEARNAHSAMLIQPGEPNCASAPAACLGDGGVVGGGVWRRREYAGPASCGAALGYDEARARAVSYGGFICQQNPFFSNNRLQEFSGESWLLRTADPSSSFEAPGPLYDAKMAYHAPSQNMVMVGGRMSTGGFVAETWLWDGGAWQKVDSAPPGRHRHGMAWDARTRRVLVFGGLGASGALLGDTWAWDGARWSELDAGTLPGPREAMAMSWDDERDAVVLQGGLGADGGARSDGFYFDGEQWLPDDRFTDFSPLAFHELASDRQRAELHVLGSFHADGGVAIGGCEEPYGAPRGASQLWAHGDGGWRLVAHIDLCRKSPLVFFDQKGGRLLVGAGYLGKTVPAEPPNPVQEFLQSLAIAGANNRFLAPAPDGGFVSVNEYPEYSTPYARTNHAMAYDPDFGETMISGGESGSERFDTEYFWDGIRWRATGSANSTGRPGGRALHAVAYDRKNKRYVSFGGLGEAGSMVVPGAGGVPNHLVDAGTWTYDRKSPAAGWSRLPFPTTVVPRLGHAMVWNPVSERVVMTGGASVLVGDLGEFYAQLNGNVTARQAMLELTPTGWVQINKLPGTQFAFHAGATYDTARGKLVTLANSFTYFNGAATDPGRILECDGDCRDGGSAGFSAYVPPARRQQALAYDVDRQKVLMLGAAATELDRAVQDRLWDWDPVGNTWKEVPVTLAEGEGTLTPRSGASMVFDERRSRAVVFGGATTELFELEYTGRRPALTWLVSLAAANIDDGEATVTRVDVLGAAGGSGQLRTGPGFSVAQGVQLEAWIRGGWRSLGAVSSAPAAGPLTDFAATFPETEWPRIRAPGDRLAIALSPIGANGREAARISARDVKLVIRLKHRP